MRNLKKILALVLALVMSLSLMSVAGATEFPDSDQISETYAESVDVLTGLKVFQGNKGEFKPKDNITRAEVANIIYRIVTGDVDGTSVGIYADYNKFTDVPNTAWFAGCVNYCANAEYIKGRGNGKFDPYGNVTGYEALAMILRAIGYDKNGEFTGANWQVQTAATARNRGITKHIVEGTLGVAASREMVAEILCQTILVPVADYSLAFGYRTTDAVTGKENETLAKKTFGMERLEGVVTANEYADLEKTSPLAADQTKIGDKTLNVHSTLDDLGESRYVYVIPQDGTTRYDLVSSKVYDTGDNNVYDSGDEVKTVGDSTGKDNGITSLSGAKHLRNYSPMTDDVSDWRIEYVIKLAYSEYAAMTMFRDNGTADNSKLYSIAADGTKTEIAHPGKNASDAAWNRSYVKTGDDGYTYEYRKVVVVGDRVTATDRSNIEAIFAKSTHIVTPGTINPIGEVYVGTSTRPNDDDISNKISHVQFVETYLHDKNNTIGHNGLGNRLKIVDNDNDGVAEYVLQTVYTVAIVSGVTDSKISLDVANATFDKLGDGCHSAHTTAPRLSHSTDNCNEITSSTKTAVYAGDEVANGDVVLYALIDGVALMEKAEGVTARISSINRTAKTATTDDGTEYNESTVHEHSNSLSHTVENLVHTTNTTYNLYFDKYGNLAAFTEGVNGDFVLVTDGWFDSKKASDEYAVRAYIDGSIQTVDVTGNGNMFIYNRADASAIIGTNIINASNDWGRLKWFADLNSDGGINTTNDKVRTTVAQLQDGVLVPVDKAYFYNRTMAMIEMNDNVIPRRDNIATSKGWVHATDWAQGTAYTQVLGLAADNTITAAKTAANAIDVRGLSTTTYYYVYNYYTAGGAAYNTVVRTYTGYSSLPTVPDSQIEDVYAVGTYATTASGTPYYTADIVVVELNADYTKRDSEQVFIPEISTVTGGIESIEMIRGDGTRETVTVDLRISKLNSYDPAGSTQPNLVKAGLYFMDESDTQKGIYIIEAMSLADIQNSNYAVGFVNKTTSSAGADWTSVDLFVSDATNGIANYNDEIAKRHTDNSKYYTLGYNAYGNAELTTETDKFWALRQNPDSVIDPQVTNPAWMNETLPGNSGVHRNEVLMAYDNSGNIRYTVSFREYRTGTTRDAAQNVWWSLMPTRYGADPAATYPTAAPASVTLGYDTGVAPAAADATPVNFQAIKTLGASETITWATWKAAAGKEAWLKIEPATGNTCWITVNGTSYTFTDTGYVDLGWVYGDGTSTTNHSFIVSSLGDKTGESLRTDTYNVALSKADGRFGTLQSTDTTRVQTKAATNNADSDIIVNNGSWSIQDVVDKLSVTGCQIVDYKAYTDSAKLTVAADGTKTIAGTPIEDRTQTYTTARWLVLTVKNGANETKDIFVYRENLNDPWNNNASFNSVVTVGDGVQVFLGCDTTTGKGNNTAGWNTTTSGYTAETLTGGKLTISGGLQNYATRFFIADGEGEFVITDTETGANVGIVGGRGTYSWVSNKTIVETRISGNITVNFVPAAGRVAVSFATKTTGDNAVSAAPNAEVEIRNATQATTPGTQNVANSTTLKLHVKDNYEPVVTASNGAVVGTPVDRGSDSNKAGFHKWDVEISNLTADTTVTVGVKFAGKSLAGTLVATKQSTNTIRLNGITVSNPNGVDQEDVTLTVNVAKYNTSWDTNYYSETVKVPASDAAASDALFTDLDLTNSFPAGTYRVTVSYTIASTGETGTFTAADLTI